MRDILVQIKKLDNKFSPSKCDKIPADKNQTFAKK